MKEIPEDLQAELDNISMEYTVVWIFRYVVLAGMVIYLLGLFIKVFLDVYLI